MIRRWSRSSPKSMRCATAGSSMQRPDPFRVVVASLFAVSVSVLSGLAGVAASVAQPDVGERGGAERGQEVRLWPAGAPGSGGITAPEVSKPSANPKYKDLPGAFTVTHYPSIYVFLPPEGRGTGAAII